MQLLYTAELQLTQNKLRTGPNNSLLDTVDVQSCNGDLALPGCKATQCNVRLQITTELDFPACAVRYHRWLVYRHLSLEILKLCQNRPKQRRHLWTSSLLLS